MHAQAMARPKLLGANPWQAMAHQKAVLNVMKKNQEDLRADSKTPEHNDDLTALLAVLENLLSRSRLVTLGVFEGRFQTS